MKRTFIVAYFFAFLVFGISAQEQKIKRSDVVETLRGVPYYIHFVTQGETLSALAEAYAVTAEEITRSNPEVAGGLKANQVLKIPFKPGNTSVNPEDSSDEGKVSEQALSTIEVKRHKVEPRETWYGISRLYQVTVKELIAANPGTDTLRIGMQIVIPGAASGISDLPREGSLQHTVQPQETIYSIIRKYNITAEALASANPGIADGLKTGQVLAIPAVKTNETIQPPAGNDQPAAGNLYKEHIVEKKETLYGIARQYGLEIADILKANPGLSADLKKGETIRIPLKSVEKPVSVVPDVSRGQIVKEQVTVPQSLGPCEPGYGRNEAYRVALMIPFMLEEADSINTTDLASLRLPSEYHSLDFIQFYEGALIAIDSLTRAGMDLKVYVFDTDAGEQVTKTRRILARAEMADVDLIIGPFFAKSFELVAAFAASHSIPVVNPLSHRSEIVQNNPSVFKIQPSPWNQYNETSRYIAETFTGSNVFILRRNKDENSSMAETIKTSIESISGGLIKVKEAIYSQSFDAGLFNNLVTGKSNVVIVLTSDQALLPALLRKMNDARGKYNITVFGLPAWESMELDSHYLLNLNTHLFNGWFVDYSNPEVKSFISVFKQRFKTEPVLDKYAFLGYDISLYFLSNLFNYGRSFGKCLNTVDHKGLSTGFTFRKSENGGYENTAASVYQLKDYKRILVNH